jgi:hypothetical protein
LFKTLLYLREKASAALQKQQKAKQSKTKLFSSFYSFSQSLAFWNGEITLAGQTSAGGTNLGKIGGDKLRQGGLTSA